jgi:phenol 2-monooxygenase (NADPH)
MMEVCFWNPDEHGGIRRTARTPDVLPGLSRFSEVVLHQGRMEQFFLDAIRASYASDAAPSEVLHVERCTLPASLEIDEATAGNFTDPDVYPVTVRLRKLTEDEATPTQMLSNLRDGMFRSNLVADDVDDLLKGSQERAGEEEIVKAKFVVGCDGAHSWVRKCLGKEFEMKGEMTDFIWYEFSPIGAPSNGPCGAC